MNTINSASRPETPAPAEVSSNESVTPTEVTAEALALLRQLVGSPLGDGSPQNPAMAEETPALVASQVPPGQLAAVIPVAGELAQVPSTQALAQAPDTLPSSPESIPPTSQSGFSAAVWQAEVGTALSQAILAAVSPSSPASPAPKPPQEVLPSPLVVQPGSTPGEASPGVSGGSQVPPVITALEEHAVPAVPVITSTESEVVEPETLGSMILESLAAGRPQTPPPAVPSGAPEAARIDPAQRVNTVESLINSLTDHVLVSDPLNSTAPEVRIKLADQVLPETEVRIWRAEGRLQVEFVTASPDLARVLADSATALSTRLTERLQLPDAALVTVQTSGGAPGDGRSRERFGAWAQNPEEQDGDAKS